MRIKNLLVLVTGSLCLAFGSAHAVTVGGFTFSDNAFADSVNGMSGTFNSNTTSFITAITDLNEDTYVAAAGASSFMEIGFTDNNLVNDTGGDLVIFELGTLNNVSVALSLGGPSMSFPVIDTGFNSGLGFTLNAAVIDLTDLGVADAAILSSIVIGGANASIGLVGANPASVVPVPAAVWLFGSGLLGLAGVARRKR